MERHRDADRPSGVTKIEGTRRIGLTDLACGGGRDVFGGGATVTMLRNLDSTDLTGEQVNTGIGFGTMSSCRPGDARQDKLAGKTTVDKPRDNVFDIGSVGLSARLDTKGGDDRPGNEWGAADDPGSAGIRQDGRFDDAGVSVSPLRAQFTRGTLETNSRSGLGTLRSARSD